MTLFIPGPLLQPGVNELLLLEMHRIPDVPAGEDSPMASHSSMRPAYRLPRSIFSSATDSES